MLETGAEQFQMLADTAVILLSFFGSAVLVIAITFGIYDMMHSENRPTKEEE